MFPLKQDIIKNYIIFDVKWIVVWGVGGGEAGD